MRNILFFISLLLLQVAGAQSYDTYFTKEALRLDFFLFGTNQSTHVALKGLKQEPLFGGSHTNLIHPNQGEYRIQVLEPASGKVLYSKGFITLLEEWQSLETDETKTEFFEIPLQVPYPKAQVKVNFDHRKTE